MFRDGLKDSNVVTKTFNVENAGSPDDNDYDDGGEMESMTSYRDENDFRPVQSCRGPQRTAAPGSASARVKVRYVHLCCY